MRISDWSSDVCSSDLGRARHRHAQDRERRDRRPLGSRRTEAGARRGMSGFRLDSGGLVDRGRPLSFTFDGRRYQGFTGDTLASALLASGVDLYGRSFKYHRPRGLFSAGVEEPNALVTLRSGARAEPNTRATVAELYRSEEHKSELQS